MNISAKINSLTTPNGLVIGENLFAIVKGLEQYAFIPATDTNSQYKAFHVEEKESKGIINPFERRTPSY
ncbi:MAG: hypothetical protein AB1351_03790 [Thermoproteota archaeon]